MKRNSILVLLCGIALLWHTTGQTSDTAFLSSCPGETQPWCTAGQAGTVDVAQFPLSSCVTDTAYASASAAVSDSTPYISSSPIGGVVYQATFRASDWSGQLLAYTADPITGSLSQDTNFNVTTVTSTYSANTPLPLYSFWSPDDNCFANAPSCFHHTPSYFTGILFNLDNINYIQRNSMDSSGGSYISYLIDYIKGFSLCENSPFCKDPFNDQNTLSFRKRSVLLGDLVNSNPLFVGSEDFNYYSLKGNSGNEGSTYQAFVNQKSQPVNTGGTTNTPRPRMVYVGGNDGMLHGFPVGTWEDSDGFIRQENVTEAFSFLPGAILNINLSLRALVNSTPKLYQTATDALLGTQGRTYPMYHRYLVDGSPITGDAYLSFGWHSVLLGTTGASPASVDSNHVGMGGRSIFALDVTDPLNFGVGNVLWEFTDNNSILLCKGAYEDNNCPSYGADADLGMTLSQPSLARMQNGKWAAIVGNGYNSARQIPVLYILDISLTPDQQGFVIAKFSPCVSKISVDASITYPLDSQGTLIPAPNPFPNLSCLGGQPNGLSSPIAVDVDGDQKVDYIYAGDLQGNLWKFDVNCTSRDVNTGDNTACQPNSTGTDWKVANNGNPLFVACDPNTSGCGRQPITSKPQVGSVGTTQAYAQYTTGQSKPSVMVYFGTGIYLGLTDVTKTYSSSTGLTDVTETYSSSTQQQTFYALWDKNTGDATTTNVIPSRSSLLQQQVLTGITLNTISGSPSNEINDINDILSKLRVTSDYTPCYRTTCPVSTTNTSGEQQLGWYLDLNPASTTSSRLSERSVSFPSLLNGNIVFTTLVPTPDPCTSPTQASSWVNELNAITGSRPSNPAFLNIFGTNPSYNASSNDFVTFSRNGTSTSAAPSGIQSTVGILKTPALIYGKGVINKYFSGSMGSIQNGSEGGIVDPGAALGRVSWRQLR